MPTHPKPLEFKVLPFYPHLRRLQSHAGLRRITLLRQQRMLLQRTDMPLLPALSLQHRRQSPLHAMSALHHPTRMLRQLHRMPLERPSRPHMARYQVLYKHPCRTFQLLLEGHLKAHREPPELRKHRLKLPLHRVRRDRLPHRPALTPHSRNVWRRPRQLDTVSCSPRSIDML